MAETNAGERRRQIRFSAPVAAVLLILRLVIGWHFLYEGLAKLLTPDWTTAPYLLLSRGLFAGFFHSLAASPETIRVVDFLNIWGLILIGLALILGVMTRLASRSGVVLLALYYLSQMPLIRPDFRLPVEGHYLIVNKNLVELFALLIFCFLPPGSLWGLGRMWCGWRTRRKLSGKAAPAEAGGLRTRRETLENLIGAPVLGLLGYAAHKKYEWEKLYAVTGATIKLQNLSLTDLKGKLPQGNLGKLKVSRLILGANLVGGWAHSRDLIYVPSLFKAYNTDRKVFETLELAERAGINSFLPATPQMPQFNKYREVTGSKMQTICQVFPTPQDLKTDIDKAIDYGATSLYVQGHFAERFVKNGQIDLLGKALDYMKSQGYVAGIGSHSIEVQIACEKEGLNPDYYVKTLHSDKYWSATPLKNRVEWSVDTAKLPDHDQFHDNMFDLFPDKTIAFMENVQKPWIAFKVLAAGAFHPKDGFRFAFENGADFICVGIFDFQMIEDVNVALDVLSTLNGRKRPWRA